MRRSNTKSSFNGILREIPEVSVDNFQNTTCKAYFLSHCHSDHTSGLFSEALLEHLKKNQVYIYMSKPSAAIVRHESGNMDIGKFIRPLEVGVQHTLKIPRNELTEIEDAYITVSLIPAAHCFGSVMFLFRTLYKTVLYTGDFRISTNSVAKYAQFYEDGEIVKLDALYIDTTFLTDEHEEFPKRSESVETILRYIRNWLQHCDTNQVALHTSARYGYEYVFNEIYKKLGEKVYIAGDVWKLYSQFPKQVCGVTNEPTNTRIHLCKNRSDSCAHSACLPNQNVTKSTFLYVHFSALKWTGYTEEDLMIQRKLGPNTYRIDVCFATHCSRSEIEYFVSFLSPEKVVGFPNEYVVKEKEIDKFAGKRKVSASDEVVQKVPKMVDEKLMRELFDD